MRIAFMATMALLMWGGMAPADRPEAVELQAGFGQADITPDLKEKPVYLAGFGKNRKATGVHDPIMARAVVLGHGQSKIALVSVDLVGLFLDVVEKARQRLPGFAYVLVSSTHNHEGPDTLGLWGPTLFQTGVDPAYLKQVEDGIVAAVNQADRKLQAVTARYGRAADAALLHDSRLPVLKHDELVALEFRTKAGKSSGLVVQWNCHPETLDRTNTLLSADYVYATIAYLEKKHGCPVVYLTGTVGGLMSSLGVHVKDNQGRPLQNGTFEKTERYGQLVGELADKALVAAETVRLGPFDIRTKSVYLPIDNQLYQLGWKMKVLRRQAYVWHEDPAKVQAIKDKAPDKGRMCIRSEIGYLKLGELEVACIPGEIYPELVLGKFQDPPEPNADFPDAPLEPSLYAQMKGPRRMLIGVANDEIGYIIPKRQWDEQAPFCYGRKTAQYGEVNSLGPDTAPILCDVFRKLVAGR